MTTINTEMFIWLLNLIIGWNIYFRNEWYFWDIIYTGWQTWPSTVNFLINPVKNELCALCFWICVKNKLRGSAAKKANVAWWRSGSTQGFALQIQCYQCEEFQLNHDYSNPEFIMNCTVNIQDMCQKEVMEHSAAVWLTESWCSSRVSGRSLWGGRAEFRTLDHQRPPSPT